MKLLSAYPFLRIYHHAGSCSALELVWREFVGSDGYRQSMNQLLILAQQYQIEALIIDDRHMRGARPKDLEWAKDSVLLPMIENGLRRLAVVASADPMNRLVVERSQQTVKVNAGYERRVFDNIVAARLWALN